MRTYARIFEGELMEIIKPYLDVPIEDRFHPDIWPSLIDITNTAPTPQEGFLYDGSEFRPKPQQPSEEGGST